MATRAGRSAYGAASMKAMEAFTPENQRLFDDPLVVDLLPGFARFAVRRFWIRGLFAAMLDRTAPGVRGSLLCRTRWIDDAVTNAVKRGLGAVVLLGAGLDTRPWRLTALAQGRVFEVDLPSVQGFKRERLRRLGLPTAHVRFLSTDFNAEPLGATLARGGLAPDEPAIFVWEGVTQYLTPGAVDAVLRFVAGRPAGSELLFTYVLREAITGEYRAGRSEDLRRVARRRPEPWLFGLDPSEVGAFVGARGLTLRTDVGAEEHLARYVRPLGRDLQVSEIERVARVTT